jgi:hypothetical protein
MDSAPEYAHCYKIAISIPVQEEKYQKAAEFPGFPDRRGAATIEQANRGTFIRPLNPAAVTQFLHSSAFFS